jgi:integrase
LTIEGKTYEETGEEDVIVLPPQVLKLISFNGDLDSNIVDPKSLRSFWDKLRIALNLDGLWMRDLRRTYATIGNNNGIAYGQIGELLNHKSLQTTKVYAKLGDKKRIDAALAIAESIQKMIQ